MGRPAGIAVISDDEQRCHVHPARPAELWCRTDRTLICLKCAAVGHRGHDLAEACEADAEARTELRRLLECALAVSSDCDRVAAAAESARCEAIADTDRAMRSLEDARSLLHKAIEAQRISAFLREAQELQTEAKAALSSSDLAARPAASRDLCARATAVSKRSACCQRALEELSPRADLSLALAAIQRIGADRPAMACSQAVRSYAAGCCPSPSAVVIPSPEAAGRPASSQPRETWSVVGGERGYKDGLGSAAQFNGPYCAVLNELGEVLVSDGWNNSIRKISSDGSVTTLCGTAHMNHPMGLAYDRMTGFLYVADKFNHRVLRVSRAGMAETVAGSGSAVSTDGRGLQASFDHPYALALDPASGDLLVGEEHRVRRVTRSGVVTTVAGRPWRGYRDGLAREAEFCFVRGVQVAGDGTIFVADWGNHSIRCITPEGTASPPALWRSRGTCAGVVNTLVDLRPRGCPAGMCLDPSGCLLFSDFSSGRVSRLVRADRDSIVIVETTRHRVSRLQIA
eukprot:m51a1_g14103 hypothetical protein (515) ;mRNA; r:96984-99145